MSSAQNQDNNAAAAAASVNELTEQVSKITLNEEQPQPAAPAPPQASKKAQRKLQVVKLVAEKIKSGNYKNIIILSGAGLSTAAGIPDFRSPKTGLYSTLQKYNLADPTDVFSLSMFKSKPEIFYQVSKEVFLTTVEYKPTKCHRFIKLLNDKNMLLRNYTQNIDGLELKAGLPKLKLIQVHGNLQNASCISCGAAHDMQKDVIDVVAKAPENQGGEIKVVPKCKKAPLCKGNVKPDVVLFGESLPPEFTQARKDCKECDLMIIIGTSLQVFPVCNLIDMIPRRAVRVLVNREKTGPFIKCRTLQDEDEAKAKEEQEQQQDKAPAPFESYMETSDTNTSAEAAPAYEDFFIGGDIEESAQLLIDELGWTSEFSVL